MKKAIILLSGGLDSATVLAIAVDQGFSCYCISFDYGQRHAVELEAAKKVASRAKNVLAHEVIKIDLSILDSSSLINHKLQIPKHTDVAYIKSGAIPNTYVPARNTIFLSYALGYAESIGASHIFIGCNVIDYSNYPDCTPDYLSAFETMANLGIANREDAGHIFIIAPLLHLSKSETILMGVKLGVDYSITMSCYDPKFSMPCGKCDACVLRKAGFNALKLEDPANKQL